MFDIGNVTSYGLVPLTLIMGYWQILPQLQGWNKTYYHFLMAWSVPYVIGNVYDFNKIGPQWVQYHLLDMSYVQWATTLGVTVYVIVAKLRKRTTTQQSIMIALTVSFVIFLLGACAWEISQNWISWYRYSTVDWSDYSYYAVGASITCLPFIALRRLPIAVVRPS